MPRSATAPTQEYRAKLRQNLNQYLSETDLRNLCYDLGVDYDSLPGEGKDNKARELIIYLEDRDRIPELVKTCKEWRPNVHWNAERETVTPPSPRPATQPTPEIVMPPSPRPAPGCKMQARLIIIVAAVVLVSAVALSVRSLLSDKSFVEAPTITSAKPTDTPPFIALALTALSTPSAPAVTRMATPILATSTTSIAATTTSTSHTWENWVKVRSFPAPASGPDNIIRQADNLWVSTDGGVLYYLNLMGDIVSETHLAECQGAWAWDGQLLWVARGSTIFQCNPNSWKETALFETELGQITGIAWDGSALWVIDEDGNLVRYDRDGKRLRRLAVPVWAANLVWVEGELWVLDFGGPVTRFDSSGFEQAGWFHLNKCGISRVSDDMALYWDGTSLWIADTNGNRILQCSPAD